MMPMTQTVGDPAISTVAIAFETIDSGIYKRVASISYDPDGSIIAFRDIDGKIIPHTVSEDGNEFCLRSGETFVLHRDAFERTTRSTKQVIRTKGKSKYTRKRKNRK